MDALLAMQLESLMLFSLVVAAFMLRFILVQLAICLHRKAIYEQQLAAHPLKPTLAPLMAARTKPIVISPAQPAFSHFPTDYSVV